jgi:hypothetical protein
MSTAKDLKDARLRAGNVLQNFEGFVTNRAKSEEVCVHVQVCNLGLLRCMHGAQWCSFALRCACLSSIKETQQVAAWQCCLQAKATSSRVVELQKDNAILKRAVQIQNAKLQERSQQEQEVGQLRQVLAQYQEQVRALELTNYSLSLHLSRATSGSSMAAPHHHGPDVF